jgi:hypothetical protein
MIYARAALRRERVIAFRAIRDRLGPKRSLAWLARQTGVAVERIYDLHNGSEMREEERELFDAALARLERVRA